MGLDGLSISNLGLNKTSTSAEVVAQALQAAKEKSEKIVKQVDEMKSTKLDLKDQYEEKTNYEGRDTSGGSQDSDRNYDLPDENIIKHNGNKYKVKFNEVTGMVDLIDRLTGIIIETISPSELLNLVSKSSNPSGILVDSEL